MSRNNRLRRITLVFGKLLLGEATDVCAEPVAQYSPRAEFLGLGVKEMRVTMRRRGWVLGRGQTRRLMWRTGLRSIQRSNPVFTTMTDPAAAVPADLVCRRFAAAAPKPVALSYALRKLVHARSTGIYPNMSRRTSWPQNTAGSASPIT